MSTSNENISPGLSLSEMREQILGKNLIEKGQIYGYDNSSSKLIPISIPIDTKAQGGSLQWDGNKIQCLPINGKFFYSVPISKLCGGLQQQVLSNTDGQNINWSSFLPASIPSSVISHEKIKWGLLESQYFDEYHFLIGANDSNKFFLEPIINTDVSTNKQNKMSEEIGKNIISIELNCDNHNLIINHNYLIGSDVANFDFRYGISKDDDEGVYHAPLYFDYYGGVKINYGKVSLYVPTAGGSKAQVAVQEFFEINTEKNYIPLLLDQTFSEYIEDAIESGAQCELEITLRNQQNSLTVYKGRSSAILRRSTNCSMSLSDVIYRQSRRRFLGDVRIRRYPMGEYSTVNWSIEACYLKTTYLSTEYYFYLNDVDGNLPPEADVLFDDITLDRNGADTTRLKNLIDNGADFYLVLRAYAAPDYLQPVVITEHLGTIYYNPVTS